jgi:hypothetical protein
VIVTGVSAGRGRGHRVIFRVNLSQHSRKGTIAMTAPHIIDPGRLLGQALSDASPDLMRHLLSTVINALLSADADGVCGAEYGVSSPERVNQRNGYRHRELDTRAGTIDVAVPKLRQGSYFPGWLLERRDQAIHKPRSFVQLGLARRRSLICSLIHSTHIGIKRPSSRRTLLSAIAVLAIHWTFQL